MVNFFRQIVCQHTKRLIQHINENDCMHAAVGAAVAAVINRVAAVVVVATAAAATTINNKH